ncbi:Phosphate transporter like protein, partial [Aduncisulcus paluster]
MVVVLSYSFISTGGIPNNLFLAIAALFGAYMAMNIGANDVANNVGPAVGSKALTMGGAIVIAAIFEASGALIAATMAKAPVSTTHSIVGGVMGAGIAAAGFSIVAWGTVAKIALSWIVSPILGGVVAALFLFAIKKTIVYKEDKIEAATKW